MEEVTYQKTAQDVKEYFPYGAVLVQDNVPPIELINLEVRTSERNATILTGWAYPNKNFSFELDNVLPQKKGWLVFSGGKRVVLRPLSEARYKVAQELADTA